MNILFIGPISYGNVTYARLAALRDMNHAVTVCDQNKYLGAGMLGKIQRHLLVGPGVQRYNAAIKAFGVEARFDLAFVDNAAHLWPATVAQLCQFCPCVAHYSSEYFGFRSYLYRHLRRSASWFHAHVITNALTAADLRQWGARNIVMTEFGFDPDIHRRVDVSDTERHLISSDVAFGGHWEPFYEKMIGALIKAGISVRVCGPGWHRSKCLERGKWLRRVPIEVYQKMMSSTRIGVSLLSKWNHNRTGGRLFEIPAFGRFLLAERTPEQLMHFREGTEAAYFGDEDELVAKAREYLADDEARATIAAAGFNRCITSGYTYRDRMQAILEALAAKSGTGNK